MLLCGLLAPASARTKKKAAPKGKAKVSASAKIKAKAPENAAETPANPAKAPKGKGCKGDTAVDCWNEQAVALAKQGKLEDARLAMEAAFRADPRLRVLRGNLESVYAGLASRAYDSALGLEASRSGVDLALLPSEARRRSDARPARAVPARDTAPVVRGRIALDSMARLASRDTAVRPRSKDSIKVAAKDSVRLRPRDTAKVVARDSIRLQHPKDTVKVAVRDTLTPRKDSLKLAARDLARPLAKDTSKVASAARVRRTDSVPARPARDSALVRASARDSLRRVAALRKDSLAALKLRARPEDPREVRKQISAALDEWAKAWSEKDVEGYLGTYAPAFQPANGMDRQRWEAFRRERLLAPASIEVRIEELKVEPQEEGRQLASFLQTYRTEATRLRSRKRLVLEKIGKRWMIAAEGEAK